MRAASAVAKVGEVHPGSEIRAGRALAEWLQRTEPVRANREFDERCPTGPPRSAARDAADPDQSAVNGTTRPATPSRAQNRSPGKVLPAPSHASATPAEDSDPQLARPTSGRIACMDDALRRGDPWPGRQERGRGSPSSTCGRSSEHDSRASSDQSVKDDIRGVEVSGSVPRAPTTGELSSVSDSDLRKLRSIQCSLVKI